MVQYERPLQTEIMLHLRAERPRCVVVPIPNGAFFPAHSPGERSIINRLVARMKDEGFMLPGAFDLACLWDCGVIELKKPATRDLFGQRSPAGRPSDAQKEFAARCTDYGVRHAYCHSWDEVRAALVEWGRL